MCKVFTPEDYFASGSGLVDDLGAFNAMISDMDNGDVAQLAGKTYRLDGTLHVNKRIAIVGENVNPHYGVHRSRLRFPANVVGLRLLRGATVRDVAVTAATVNSQPGSDRTAHGIWCRRTAHLENVFVERFGGHGVSLDTRTIERAASAVSVAVDSSGRSIATATVAGNTGLLSIIRDMEIDLFGYTASLPSTGGIVLSDTATTIVFEMPGTPSGPLTGITRTVSSASVTVDPGPPSVRRCTAVVGTNHRLLPNMHITTTDAIDTPILSVGGDRVTFALTTAGPGPVQGDNLTVTRGLIRTDQNCDHWQATNVRCNNNGGHGWHTLGARSNAGCAINVDCTNNFQSGIHEQSFLGNTYVACHTAENSRSTINPGDPVWPSYNKPREADNNRSKFYNCYSEGSVAAEVWYPATATSGSGNWTGDGLASSVEVSYGRSTLFVNRDRAPGRDPNLPENRVDFNIGGPRGAIFSFEAAADERPGAQSQPYRLQFVADPPESILLHWFALQHLSSGNPRPTPIAFSGVRSTDATGQFTNVGQIWFPNGFYYGRGQAKQNAVDRGPYRATTYRETGPTPATRAVAWGTEAPSGNQDGTWSQGDIVWNAAAAVGDPAGWMCVESGTATNPAGVWAAMGSLT